MAHLASFGLENFRVFKEMTNLEFAPITVFTGTNSSGKSSVNKALMLLKDNFEKFSEKNFNLEAIDFTSGNHKLANFSTCLNNQSEKNTIKFRLPFSFEYLPDKFFIELTYELDSENQMKNGSLISLEVFKDKDDLLVISFKYLLDFNEWNYWMDFSFFRERINERVNFLTKIYTRYEYREKRNRELRCKADELFYKNGGTLETKSTGYYKKYLSEEEQKEYQQLDDEFDEWGDAVLDKGYNSRFCSENIIWDCFYFNELIKIKEYEEFMPDKPLSVYPLFIENTDIESIYSLLTDEYIELHKYKLEEFLKGKQKLLKRDFLAEQLNKKFDYYKTKIFDYFKSEIELNDDSELISLFIKDELYLYENYFKQKYDKEYAIYRLLSKGFEVFIREVAISIQIENFYTFYKIELIVDKFVSSRPTLVNKLYNLLIKFQSEEGYGIVVLLEIYNDLNKEKYKKSNSFFFNKFILDGFDSSIKKTIRTLSEINFLESNRANTQRVYTYNTQGTEFNELLKEFLNIGFKEDALENKFINYWIGEFDIGDKFKSLIIEGVGSSISIDNISLADKGYGVTQFLPILIKIAVIARNNRRPYEHWDFDVGYSSSILIIEEPETNLHPKLQSKLADMFVDAAKKFHIQFIIETHSEYLIRKLQYLTAKNEIKPEDTAIYYFYHPNEVPEGEEQVKRIEIRDDGMLKNNFGTGFFDESVKLTIDLLKIQSSN